MKSHFQIMRLAAGCDKGVTNRHSLCPSVPEQGTDILSAVGLPQNWCAQSEHEYVQQWSSKLILHHPERIQMLQVRHSGTVVLLKGQFEMFMLS